VFSAAVGPTEPLRWPSEWPAHGRFVGPENTGFCGQWPQTPKAQSFADEFPTEGHFGYAAAPWPLQFDPHLHRPVQTLQIAPLLNEMSKILSVALLLDSPSAPRAVADLVSWLGGQHNMRCSLIVVPPAAKVVAAPSLTTPISMAQPWRAFLWRLMLAIEKRRVRKSGFRSQFEAPVALDEQPPAGGIYRFKTQPNETGPQLAQRVRMALGDALPDFIVQCGHGLRSGDLAHCAQHGVLELVHGSSHGSEDGSSGFWEVLAQSDKTAFAVRHVGPCGKQVKTLAHGHLPTRTTFLMNQAALVAQMQDTLKALLLQLASDASLAPLGKDVVVQPVRRDRPTARQLTAYAAAVAKRSTLLRLRTVLGVQEKWQVHYKRQAWSQLSLADSQVVPNPAGGYFADPFLRSTPEGLFCFVEEFRDSSQRGVISVLRLDAAGPVYLGRVLDEPFHLSFPYLFEYGGDLYMAPESHEAKQIRLYKCKSFPLQWELHSVVMDDVAAVDSMIFPAHGQWWMLAGVLPQGDVTRFPEMHLFSAPDPVSGQWLPHPQNPLRIDPEFARNGGLLRQGEKLFRVAQACGFSAYGASINISEITHLGANRYEELLAKRMNADSKPGVSGLHHIDNAGGTTVWDEKRWQSTNRFWRSVPDQFQSGARATASQLKVKRT
jgi:hypothetical protein